MTDPSEPDPRLISGVACECEIFFDVGGIEATTYGHGTGQVSGVTFNLQITPSPDIRLEGEPALLSQLPGVLHLSSGRERTGRVGYMHRMHGQYWVTCYMFQEELEHTLKLFTAGMRPYRLRIESDSEFHQWVDSDNYWDDVRYPMVELTDFSLKWSVVWGPMPETAAPPDATSH